MFFVITCFYRVILAVFVVSSILFAIVVVAIVLIVALVWAILVILIILCHQAHLPCQ